jgi:hypothetical protein
MSKKNHLVFTTIYYPKVLWEIYNNLAEFSHLEEVVVWVVGDKKTPAETKTLCEQVCSEGLEVKYLDIEAQEAWGKRFPEFYSRIPYNNETRRNIGYLQALEQGCERLISIDDDNWPTKDDFLGGHLLTGSPWTESLISEASGFHNVCEYLEFTVQRPIYPRGFPFRLRESINQAKLSEARSDITIGVTAGLWLREPDIDAVTWLNGKVLGIDYKGPKNFALEHNTWSPINTQNTSVIRDLIPAYLCIPMGWDVPGGKIQRYGDIWGGYFLQAVMNGLNYYVAFGRPLVDHKRNPHDYVDDLRQEFWGMILTDWLLDLLRCEFKPTDLDVCDRVDELASFLLSSGINQLPNWCVPEMKAFLEYTAGNLSAWADVCRQLR